MKHLALAIAAVFTLSLVAPVFAQPFADVPADHWAFDAIAELAAKGILEGYPDGTFKGDRAMTRYEMAMALARILARIEAVQKSIPPPVKIPPPEVRRADIDRLQRLLNEFRAELSALGVRITAIEEDLAALRARVAQDTTLVTGDWTYVYFAASIPTVDRNRIRLTFRGTVARDFNVFLRASWNSTFGVAGAGFGAGPCVTVTTPTGTTCISTGVAFDRLVGDWVSPWGVTFRVGRDYWTLGPQGLLLVGLTSREGLRATATFGGVALTALGFFNASGLFGDGTTYGLRAQMPAIAGWTFGINYRSDRNYTGVTTVGAIGTGFSVDWSGNLGPLGISGEYASWSPSAGCPAPGVVPGVSYGCTALFVNFAVNLAALGVSQFAPALNVYYKDYRSSYDRVCGGTSCANTFSIHQGVWLGSDFTLVTGWGADLSFRVTPRLTALVAVESGALNYTPSTTFVIGDRYNAILARGTYTLSRNATLDLEYLRLTNVTTPLPSTVSPNSYALRVFFRW